MRNLLCIWEGSKSPRPFWPYSYSSSSSTHLFQSTWMYWFFFESLVSLGQKGLEASYLVKAKNKWNPVLVHFDYYLLISSKNSRVKPYFLESDSPSKVIDDGVRSIFSLAISLSSTTRNTVSFLWAHFMIGWLKIKLWSLQHEDLLIKNSLNQYQTFYYKNPIF